MSLSESSEPVNPTADGAAGIQHQGTHRSWSGRSWSWLRQSWHHPWGFVGSMWLLSRLLIVSVLLWVAPALPVPPGGVTPKVGWEVFVHSGWHFLPTDCHPRI
ncbi:hypothetical protein [Neosynechococcus sphagnicola]|uniref:hypothetical protein n=1 Tax=Neosynechococcus sphagnicola TaxID=1501145 RepID=UPI001955224C|nr:hypothetical protein [Neosynechococcus sphagnicola]